ncbi:primase C-terminal domain-containing protein [Bradyrhizobium sp. 186]|uniref:primase C-terminal domain-containing protein n=1 Tax=Bradyrhizobium sp. 186 TaxID=2782654 RepID=UPI0020015CA2|nr:primase C-terminal domain-containing protein [Bradyrhizobium sp. 186]
MPDSLIAALAEPRIKPGLPSERLHTWRALVRNGVSEGRRNDSVTQLTGLLLRRGLDPLLTLEFMLAWNLARCQPPLAASEIEAVVNSIAGREMARRRHDR